MVALHTALNPNPEDLVANMTSKTQNCYEKFIINQKIAKNNCYPP
jgi:hypothetical protein